MTPEELAPFMRAIDGVGQKLVEAVVKVSSDPRPYTLTGAADWPILAAIGVLVFGMVGLMWSDLKSTIKSHRDEGLAALDKHATSNEKAHDLIWDELRRHEEDLKACKEKCGGK